MARKIQSYPTWQQNAAWRGLYPTGRCCSRLMGGPRAARAFPHRFCLQAVGHSLPGGSHWVSVLVQKEDAFTLFPGTLIIFFPVTHEMTNGFIPPQTTDQIAPEEQHGFHCRHVVFPHRELCRSRTIEQCLWHSYAAQPAMQTGLTWCSCDEVPAAQHRK